MENHSSLDDSTNSPPILSTSDNHHPKNCSKEEMVFDYFDTSSSSSSLKLKPQTSFEMTTFRNYHERRFNDSNRQEELVKNGSNDDDCMDDRRLLQNGSKNDHHHHHHLHNRMLYDDDDDDDDELPQVVIDDSNCKYLSTAAHHDYVHPFRSAHRPTVGPGDAITFFQKVPNTQLMTMETMSSSRSDIFGELQSRSTKNFNISSSEGEELVQTDGSLKVQTTLNSPFMSSVPSNCLTNLICSIKPNMTDKSEVEKRIHRRDVRREHLRRKAPEIKSEDIPEYKGKMTVEEIIAFIDDTKDKKVNHKQLKKDESRPTKIQKYLDHEIPQEDVLEERGHEARESPSLKESVGSSKMIGRSIQEVVDESRAGSTNSSFRTASPFDIPRLVCNPPPGIEEHSVPTLTAHKEFITVQKKKKLKPMTANKYELSYAFENQSEQTIRPVAKPPSGGRQATVKTYFGFSGQVINLRNYSVEKSDDNNGAKLVPTRIPFSEKINPVDNFKEATQKLENHFDPSQFPELSSSGRRNSTGSSAPKTSDSSTKGFVFSYADIAAKSRQKKHSSDKQRRNSLQLNRQEVPFSAPEVQDSDKSFREDRDDPLDSSKIFPACVELCDCTMQTTFVGSEETDVLDISNLSIDSNDQMQSSNEDTSGNSFCKANPFCKEPVVFLDGRKNSTVTDLVFIFDPTLPPNPSGRKFDILMPQHVSYSPSSDAVALKTEGEDQNSIIPTTHHLLFTSDSIDDDNSMQHPANYFARPSPLSNHHSTGRQVVKVSPMPIVTPTVLFVRSEEECEVVFESKPRTIRIESKPRTTRSKDICFTTRTPLDHPPALRKSLVEERMATSKNHFDLCKAQMFLYAGFEECVKESKNNPNNVVVYRE